MTIDAEKLLWHAPAAMLAIDLQGVILAHSPIMPEWLGIADARHPSALVGRNLVEWFTPASRLLYETSLMPRLLKSGSVREVVMQARDHHGEVRSVLFNATVVEEADGERHVYAALMDAADRIAFERDLVDARRAAEVARSQLALLQGATSRLAVATGLDDLGHTLADAAGRAASAAWTLVRLAPEAGEREGLAERAWGSAPGSLVIGGDGVFPSEVQVCRSPQEIRLAMPDTAPGLLAEGVEALVFTPILRSEPGGSVAVGAIHSWFRRSRELGEDVLDTLKALAVQAERVTDHVRLQEGVRHRALHDGLTGLPNRVLLQERVDQMLAGARRADAGCAVLFLDLDGFKAVNDQLGHHVGDSVLCTVSQRLLETCRAGETVARLGGDEFVVALTHTDPAGARSLAQRLLDHIRLPLPGEAAHLPVSASIGVALWLPAASGAVPTSGELIAAADAAMYEAKRRGKDGIVQRILGSPSRPEEWA